MNTSFNRLATVFVAAALFGGCQRDHEGPATGSTPIRVYTVGENQVAEKVISSGAIEAVEKSDIAFMVPGRVVAVDIEEGMLVQKGQLLARLDPGDYASNLAIAEATLQEVQARHARLARMHKLGSLTDTDFDKIDAALKQSTSAAELARRQLGYTELRAPFEGWIVKHGIEAGVVVSPGIPVFTLRSPGQVWANIGVAEVDIAKVQVGQTVEVYVPSTQLAPQVGKVKSILPNADMLSRAFTVKVRVENAARGLRHGNVVVGHILTGKTRSAVTVPPQVVQKNPDGSLFVWVIDADRQVAVRQIVEIGALRATEVEIAAGLKEGDRIVLNVPHTLFEGARLTVVSN